MKRTGFTLVELMVVIAVIALLAAIVLPSMSSVYSLARATICRGNLQRLGNAFSIAGSRRIQIVQSAGMADVASIYPEPMAWPTVPRNAVSDDTIYVCPEDPIKSTAVGDMFKFLEYKNEHGRFPMNTLGGASTFYKSQVGSDGQRTFTDFLLQDDYGNGQFELMDFHGWIDTDGVVRVYHTGEVFVYDRIPNTPEWSGSGNRGPGYPDRVNTCGNLNAIWWKGEPAWANGGGVQRVRGQTFRLPGWNTAESNYGINSYAHEYAYGSKCIVLVDYKELIVEVDTPLEAEEVLLNSARHLGKVNTLLGDGSVRPTTPLEISPRLHLSAWDPGNKSGRVP
jgi:prepilin-type N-terminal cleavage/methylation domain-containing protein/prepilin-type processing-associated H-X9-DG protein